MYYWAQPSYGDLADYAGYPVYNIHFAEALQRRSHQWRKQREDAGSNGDQLQTEQQSGFRDVLTQLQQSLYALEVQCSFATQMKLTAETKNLAGLEQLHKHNYEASYHRTTAIGCLYRILSGERHPHLFGIMIHCMIESEEHDRASANAIQQMKQHAKGAAETWVETVRKWHSLQMSHLEQAMRITRGLVGEQMWQYAMGLEY